MVYNKIFPDKPEKTYSATPCTGPSCKFNEGVACNNRDSKGRRIEQNCEKCGWNPVVSCQRTHDIKVKMGILPPDKTKIR